MDMFTKHAIWGHSIVVYTAKSKNTLCEGSKGNMIWYIYELDIHIHTSWVEPHI